jgi:dipeptidyl aminopeptidase/acylaminoacyl peptidase
VAFVVCSGRLASFDGTPLDADLTLPARSRGRLPLMVMLHGWGLSKTDFEASGLAGNGTNSWHWNNAWFASRGFAVLTYTARGFHRSCGKDPTTGYSYASDPACAGKASWTHLADRRWEIHDTQYLTGLLVDAGIAAPSRVVVTGDSYGGGGVRRAGHH